MKAIVLEQTGGVDMLLMKDIERPVVKENEVLVEVKAISINPVDVKIRANDAGLTAFTGKERPVILGWDIAGTVAEAGRQVSQFKKGDKIFGMANFPGRGNAYAEFVAAPEDQMALIPENISFEEAAATTLAALTALQAFHERVQKGDRMLIHAGSGGVGHYAIQLAKKLGAYVITTCSAKNRDFVLSLGVDEHIDYREEAFEEVVSNIDFVLDGMGGETLAKSLKVVKEGGTIITLPKVDFPDELKQEAKKRNVNLLWILVQSNGKDMKTLSAMLENGTLKAHVSKTFAFAEMDKAHLEIESGRTVGKLVVTI